MSEVTELLKQWNSGDSEAREQIVEHVYAELGRIARKYLARESNAADIQPTMLVHEAYMRLVDIDRIDWTGRAHFLAMAARVMRDYLVDEARKRRSLKRDGGVRVTLADVGSSLEQPPTDILALNDALERLSKADPDRALLVELRFFGGLTIEETAAVLDLSAATVKRSWQVARGWLYREINRDDSD
ncbi:MAG: ECF-type sigma factor [Pseudomonadota bacterium]